MLNQKLFSSNQNRFRCHAELYSLWWERIESISESFALDLNFDLDALVSGYNVNRLFNEADDLAFLLINIHLVYTKFQIDSFTD